MVQWLRIHLPMQGMGVQSLVQEDPKCHKATKPGHHKCRGNVLKLLSPQAWSLCSETGGAPATRSPRCREQRKAAEQQQRLCVANKLILLKKNQYSDLQNISKLS